MMRLRDAARRWVWNGLRLSLILAWASPWGRPLPLSVGDQVTVPGGLPGTGDPVVVTRGGTVSGTCVYDLVRKGRGTLDIGQVQAKSGCASDVLLFAQGRAISRVPQTWTTGADLVRLPSPPPRVKVEYNLVLVAKGGQAAQQAAWDTLQAIRLFNSNRVGLIFRANKVIKATAEDAAVIGERCDRTALLNLASRTDLYDAARLNVYFVPGTPGGWRGYTCFVAGFPNVIYISIAGDSPATLAHEFGHAFGLQDLPGRKLGHTGALSTTRIAGFVYQNMMWTGLNDLQAQEQSHFSIGQAYRMNMDKISWVIGADLVPGRTGLTCHPLVAEDSIPCPLLALDTVAVTP